MRKRWVAAVFALGLAACGGDPPPTLPSIAAGMPAYDRDDWAHWIDADGDCQDTRAEVLIRESRDAVTFRARADGRSCTVDAGLWIDPYTGATHTLAAELDVDHVVPLANAHASGGWAWDGARKRAFANDLEDRWHLVPVAAAVNRQKGARGPEEWLPPSSASWCAYAGSWRRIKERWGLSRTAAEDSAVLGLLAPCGG